MFQEIILFHRKTESAEFPDVLNREPWISWNTCLRKIRVGLKGWFPEDLKSELSADHQMFSGEEAYQFCLEVVCGLHSPMLGETEVMGQFKELCQSLSKLQVPAPIQKFLTNVMNDAKAVRSEHLVSIGSQNYGSLLRKQVKDFDHVVLLGGGQLAQEMTPWLKEKVSVRIFTRNPQKPHSWTRFLSNVITSRFDLQNGPRQNEKTAYVIAAPLTSKEIHQWMQHIKDGKIVDLRGESHEDPLNTKLDLVSLKEFFSYLEENKQKISEQVAKAKKAILDFTKARAHSVVLRPFGWDDLCA